MHTLVQVFSILNLLAFAALGVVTVRQWFARRNLAAKWAALSFGALGAVVLVARALPERPDALREHLLQRVVLAILVLFPYLLYRFTRAFRPAPRRLEQFVTAMTSIMVLWTFALPGRVPATGDPRPAWWWIYLTGFLVHWSVLSVVASARLWTAGKHQPTVARRRMQMLAFAATAITIAIFVSAGSSGDDKPGALASGIIAFASAIGFWLGLAPPDLVRMAWRRPEQARLQQAIVELVSFASGAEEVARRVLAPTADIVGARAVAVRDENGVVVAEHRGAEGPGVDGRPIEFEMQSGSLLVWTSPYAPFFGEDELNLMTTLAALTGLALDRARLFSQERDARVALERADQLKTDFIALAAHELRTPVTTIHGFVHTLHQIGHRLAPEQREELKHGLEQETARMARLVEQLLDLSRLDAEAISITPQQLNVRMRLVELVDSAVGVGQADVEVRVAGDLEANADPVVIERVVTNLVTNALRYGEPPFVVSAVQRDRHLRISVEDRGRGVPPEFVPELFERFARSEPSRQKGTGLGLAIARSYARAHRGDLLYHDAEPHGARFELVLPASSGGAGGK
jgi:signal transduction histidine kinase